MTKNIIIYLLMACILTQQTGCMLTSPKATQAQSSCDPLAYYAQADHKTSATQTFSLPLKHDTSVCIKLREAIGLSMPGTKQQNDKIAFEILKDLTCSAVLSENDQRFINMLLQHVSQRLSLNTMIADLEQRLVKTDAQNEVLSNQLKTLQSQLDQLKSIEVEIDKKVRSVSKQTDE